MKMKKTPSFFGEILAALRQLAMIAVPVVAWFALSVWIGHKNIIITYCVAYVGILIAMVFWFAHSNLKSKRDRLVSEDRYKEARNMTLSAIRKIQEGTPDPEKQPRFRDPAVRMPLDYLKPEPRKLSEVPPGEEAYISRVCVVVDLAGATWVDTGASVFEMPDTSYVRVQLIEDTGYILTLPKRDSPFQFTPGHLFPGRTYAPVIRIIDENAAAPGGANGC
jgi:hypothetical protein